MIQTMLKRKFGREIQICEGGSISASGFGQGVQICCDTGNTRSRCRFTCSNRMLEKCNTLRSKQANKHRDLQNILKLSSSTQHKQRLINSTKSLRVTQQMLIWRSSAWKCLMAVIDNDNAILILFYTVFSSMELLIFPLKRGQNLSSVKAEIDTLKLVMMSTKN